MFSTLIWHTHFLFYIQDLLNTTGGVLSSPAPCSHPPKSEEESLTLASESVGEDALNEFNP